LDKAIEIKRRAQRCIQNGDMDGALAEYEKLVDIEDSDPYNYVLLADLHYKRGDQEKAVQRYLAAVAAYEKTTLYKNAIAVCKKMMRLTLAPSKVLAARARRPRHRGRAVLHAVRRGAGPRQPADRGRGVAEEGLRGEPR
jgi:tetratricopeptide (TPR) repeat protein